MTHLQVALVIDGFLSGRSADWDWDDFTSVPIGEPRLDAIRLKCAGLDTEFPPTKPGAYCSEEGFEVMRQFVRELRGSDG